MSRPVNRKLIKLDSFEPMKVASRLLLDCFKTPKGLIGLVNSYGLMWVWDERKRLWDRLTSDELEDRIMFLLEDAVMEVKKNNGQQIEIARWADGDRSFLSRVKEVRRCLEALTRSRDNAMPRWIVSDPDLADFPPDKCIALRDKVVCVEGGRLRVIDRDERWMSPTVIDADFDEEFGMSPLWMHTLQEWLPGDWEGQELMKRWFGYLCMADRSYERGMMQLGRLRSGKGTSTGVAHALVGAHAYHGKTLEDLSSAWPYEGLETGGVCVVSEFVEQGPSEKQKTSKALKEMMGQDTVDINPKYGKKLRNVKLRVAPWLCGNEIPTLSNRGQGLAGKLLFIKFNVSFLNKENTNLLAQLVSPESLRGIAMWAIEGALALEGAAVADRWPKSLYGEAALEEFLLNSNIFEAFVRSQFNEKPGNFVDNGIIRDLWTMWCKANRIKGGVSPLHLPSKLVNECSMALEITRGPGGVRGVRGFAVRMDAKRGVADRDM